MGSFPSSGSSVDLPSNPYQVGGSLRQDAPSYVFRAADTELFQALLHGEFCYVLNARQMGKSSLRVQAKHQLQQQGVRCAAIDLTRLGSERLTVAQWYKGLISELWRSLELMDTVNVMTWLRDRAELPPVQQFSQFLDEVVLATIADPIVILVDEIDSVLSLDFSSDDFFALIRSCYEQRPERPEYERLTFALFGVASPADFIRDHHRTPFNIGRSISLQGFQFSEVRPLVAGLTGVVSEPAQALREILRWTGGQPFLTQKLCRLLLDPEDASFAQTSVARSPTPTTPFLQELLQEALSAHSAIPVRVETLVRSRLIYNWEAQDYPEHFKTIARRLVHHSDRAVLILQRYAELLEQGSLAIDHSLEQGELLLSGLAVQRDDRLEIHNPIYAEIFNADWVRRMLKSLGADPIACAPHPVVAAPSPAAVTAAPLLPTLRAVPTHPTLPTDITVPAAVAAETTLPEQLVQCIQTLSPGTQQELAIAIVQQLPNFAAQIQQLQASLDP